MKNKYKSLIPEEDLAALKDHTMNDRAITEMSMSLGWKALRAYVLGLQDLLAKGNELGEGEGIDTYGARCLADNRAIEYLDKVLTFVEATATAIQEQNKQPKPEEEPTPRPEKQ